MLQEKIVINEQTYRLKSEVKNMVKIPVTEYVKLEDGLHEGEIVEVSERSNPFKYVDLTINTGSSKVVASYPACVSTESKLGKLLTRMGATFKAGEEVEIDKYLKGHFVQFLTTTNDKGYADVLPDTVKPLKKK